MNKYQFCLLSVTVLLVLGFSNLNVYGDDSSQINRVNEVSESKIDNNLNNNLNNNVSEEPEEPKKPEVLAENPNVDKGNLNARDDAKKVTQSAETNLNSKKESSKNVYTQASDAKKTDTTTNLVDATNVKEIKNINLDVAVKRELRTKSNEKRIYDFSIINNQVIFKKKYYVHTFTRLQASKELHVNNAIYYYIKSPSGYTGWIWHGYIGNYTKYVDVKRYEVIIKNASNHNFYNHVNYGDYDSHLVHYQKNYINKKMLVDAYADVANVGRYLKLSYKGKNWGWIFNSGVYKTHNETIYKSVEPYTVRVKRMQNHDFYNHARYSDYDSHLSHYQKNYMDKTMTVNLVANVKNHGTYLRVTYKGKNWGWIYSDGVYVVKDDYLEDKITSIMNKYHLKGKVLLLNNSLVSRDVEGIGYANEKLKIENSNENIVYPSASLQKAMTAAMVVQIITESQKSNDKLSQYTTIERWFPNLKGANDITIGQLLTQTSGIIGPNDERDPGKVLSESDAILQAAERITTIASKNFHYNNDNYILLAGIIRSTTGKSYAENLYERIIKPLGLQNTCMWDSFNPTYVKALNYQYINGDYKNPRTVSDGLMSYIIGAGNMYTTPDDYYIFEKGLQDGKILDCSDYQYLTNINGKSANGYSGGMYVRKNGDIKAVYGSLANNHIGNWVQLEKDNGKGIVLFVNQSMGEDIVKQAAYEMLSCFSNSFDAR